MLGEPFNICRNLVDDHVSQGRGDRVAVVSNDQELTYDQLLRQSSRIASALAEWGGVRIEERVALIMLDSPEFIQAFLGIVRIGAVCAMMSPLLRPSDYLHALNESRARVAIVSEPLLGRISALPRAELRHLRHLIVVGESTETAVSLAELLQSGDEAYPVAPTTRDDVAVWIYSSGSTGHPKPCMHPHRTLAASIDLVGKRFYELGVDDRLFSTAKLFFNYGFMFGLLYPLGVGGQVFLWPGPSTPVNVLTIIERFRPTVVAAVPSMYSAILRYAVSQSGTPDLSSVVLAISAGEMLPAPLHRAFKERLSWDIVDAIGSTEIVTHYASNRRGQTRPGSAGRVIPGFEVRLEDDDRSLVSPGSIGNLWVRGPTTCLGFWHDHARTRQAIEGEWFRTGDKFVQDADGYLWFAGRGDDMFKVSGAWVSPVEIESVLREHPAVMDVAVVGEAGDDGLLRPKAFVVLAPGYVESPVLVGELQEEVARELTEYKRPAVIRFIEEIPRTPSGKAKRFVLREGK